VDDIEGFREFVHTRLRRLSHVAYLLTGDHHAAEDLVQVTLIKVAANWPRVAAARDPDAYVRKILYHANISAWRRWRRVREEPTAELPDKPFEHDETNRAVRRLMLEAALAKLTPRQRAVLVLRYFEDLSEADTSVILGCSVGTVKSQTHHALSRLRILAPDLADLVDGSEVFV
jgi:RNA polymerase sigma-70 factor (sigma-E family)